MTENTKLISLYSDQRTTANSKKERCMRIAELLGRSRVNMQRIQRVVTLDLPVNHE